MREWSFLSKITLTWKVIDLLVRLHPREQVRLDMIVSPAEIEVEIGKRFSLQIPFILESNVLDDSILRVCMEDKLPLTLTMILFFLLAY